VKSQQEYCREWKTIPKYQVVWAISCTHLPPKSIDSVVIRFQRERSILQANINASEYFKCDSMGWLSDSSLFVSITGKWIHPRTSICAFDSTIIDLIESGSRNGKFGVGVLYDK
jgi:hypothetical protein